MSESKSPGELPPIVQLADSAGTPKDPLPEDEHLGADPCYHCSWAKPWRACTLISRELDH